MKKLFLLPLIISFLFSFSYAQNVGIGTNNPNPNAALDIQSDSRGLLIPRMDSNARKAIAHVKGLLVYDTTTSCFWFSNGLGWLKSMASNGRQNLIEDGSNPGEMLYWNGTRWVTVDAGQQNQLLYFCNGAPAWGGCKPIISTSDITSISTTTATGGGNITNEGTASVTARGVVWSTTENPTVDLTTKTNDGSGTGSFTSNITGLSINTTYYVRSYATNANGTAYGNQVSFTTTNVDITSGLVAYYPFNGNANDESGNGNNGTVNGATLTSDRFGNGLNAFNFNRSSINEITIPTNDALNSMSNISITTWVYLLSYADAGKAGYNHFINKSDQSNNHQFVFASNSNQLYFYYGNGTTNLFSTNNLPPLNQWIHIAVTYNYDGNESTSKCKFYINGILLDENSTTIGLNQTNHNLRIGTFGSVYQDNGVDGKLDDIRIYNRALTQEEITYLATH